MAAPVKARTTPRPVPTGGRYWLHADALWLRFPSYHEAHALRLMTARYARPAAENEFNQAEILERLPMFAATIGWCWWDLATDLDTPRPVGAPGHAPEVDAILAFGAGVLDEFQDAGWSILDIVRVYTTTVTGINERLAITSEAQARSVFSQPPKDSTTTSPSDSA
jgi:hypothetical protein